MDTSISPISGRILLAFMSASLLASYFSVSDRIERWTDKLRTTENQTHFDFIIVGSGSGGALLANRLSENFNVLLLEAGGTPSSLYTIPYMAGALTGFPENDWKHLVEPQPNVGLALKNKRPAWTQGKSLGGTDNMLFMISLKGSKRDFEHWATVTNDSSWSYESVQPYFRKFENYDGHWGRQSEVHGYSGELRISPSPFKGIGKYFIAALEELGYEHKDLHDGLTEGVDFVHSATINGQRATSYNTFLGPILKRKSLTVRKFSFVEKLLIKEKENLVYGVSYQRHGLKHEAYADREVIVSAGTVLSPKLLMLSGIGSRDHLEKLRIPVVADIPDVGKNLQDHLTSHIGPFFINQPLSVVLGRDLKARAVLEFFLKQRGFLTSAGANAVALVASEIAKAKGESDWADLILIFASQAFDPNYVDFMSRFFQLNETILDSYYKESYGKDAFLIDVYLGRPKQTGEITLKSNDPYDSPIIDPKYLQNEQDLQVLIQGIKKAIRIAENTTSFQNLGTEYYKKPFPGCESFQFRSDEYFECYIRHMSIPDFHPTSSCAMGKVVDSQFKVFGVKNLRIVDASIFPQVPSTNPHLIVLMMAEKAADIIKSSYFNTVIHNS